jgi:hypothetical protein
MTTSQPGEVQAKRKGGGMLADFTPWLVYWALIGNTSFRTAVLLAFLVSAAVFARPVMNGQRPKVLEVGSFITFILLVVIAFTTNDHFLERWIQPITNCAIFLIALISVVIGRPFTMEYARESVSAEVAEKPDFLLVNRIITWVWVAAFLVMTVSAFIPPLVEGSATIRDGGDTLSVIGYWIVPIAALAFAALFSSWFPDWFRRNKVTAAQPGAGS